MAREVKKGHKAKNLFTIQKLYNNKHILSNGSVLSWVCRWHLWYFYKFCQDTSDCDLNSQYFCHQSSVQYLSFLFQSCKFIMWMWYWAWPSSPWSVWMVPSFLTQPFMPWWDYWCRRHESLGMMVLIIPVVVVLASKLHQIDVALLCANYRTVCWNLWGDILCRFVKYLGKL